MPDHVVLPSRVRFAKTELLRALTALENVDPQALHWGIRELELEDMLSDARADAAEWRTKYEALRDILAVKGTETF